MPIKVNLTGDCVGYSLSEYQLKPKPLEQQKRRFYKMDRKASTKIMNSALQSVYTRPKGQSVCFGTFTFASPLNVFTGNINLDQQFNPLYNDEISYCFEYLKRYYDLSSYLWTKELTKINTIHYHAIFTMPTYKGVTKDLNKVWCNARGYFTSNGFRTDSKKGLILRDPEKAAAYAAKYSTKSEGLKFPSPVYRISNSIQVKPITLLEGLDDYAIEDITEHTVPIDGKTHFIQTDWAEIFKIERKKAKEMFEVYRI
jgi:hypothetical protein